MSKQSGNASISAVLIAVVLTAFSVSILTSVDSTSRQHRLDREELELQYLAEAGVERALLDMNADGSGVLGSEQNPVAFGNARFWTAVADHGNGSFTITGLATNGRQRSAVAGTVERTPSAFDNAVFAGNSSGDPNYVMRFGGNGSQGDLVEGDVFSGGDLDVWGDATITGTPRAEGTVTGVDGEEGVLQPPLDLASMSYETNHDINVAAEFAAHQSYTSDDAGGSAYQVAESYPSHIFRKNPSDRLVETLGTAKDDYFLEDPYETLRVDNNMNGSDAYHITPDDDALDKVYFIDGNLWIHNKKSYSFKLYGPANVGPRMTFVVMGNIYISDNLFYRNKNQDGLALIALSDSKVSNSGNIYFGDPVFGTLRHMESFMYAENNFYDNNLDASGSANVTLFGTMSAGNHVAINRDFGMEHSQLRVIHDTRLSSGDLELPGTPLPLAERDFEIIAWSMAPIR